jgi:hypothetical protein
VLQIQLSPVIAPWTQIRPKSHAQKETFKGEQLLYNNVLPLEQHPLLIEKIEILDHGSLQNTFVQTGLAHIRALQICLGEISLRELCPAEIGSMELRTPQTGVGEIGLAEVSLTKICFNKARTDAHCFTQVCACEICSC